MIPNNILAMLGRNPDIQNLRTPDEVAQYLLNNGRVNQQQVNQARQMWQNPQIKKMIGQRYGY